MAALFVILTISGVSAATALADQEVPGITCTDNASCAAQYGGGGNPGIGDDSGDVEVVAAGDSEPAEPDLELETGDVPVIIDGPAEPPPAETVTVTTALPNPPPTGTVTTTTAAVPTPPRPTVEPDICSNHPGMKSLPNSRWSRLGDGSCEKHDPNADVAVTEQSDRSTLSVGEMVIFTLTVSNNGEGEAPDVGLRKPIPKGLELMTPNDVTTSSGSCKVEGGVGSQVVHCVFPMIDLHENATVKIRMKATAAGTTSSHAEVGTDKRADQNMGNNKSAMVIEVSAPINKPSMSTTPASKSKMETKVRTGYITVRTPGYDKPVSFRVNVYDNSGGEKRHLFQDRIWNNSTITFKLPRGVTSKVKMNGAGKAGWKLIGTKEGPLRWVYTATQVAVPALPATPTIKRAPSTPRAAPKPQLRKRATQFVWVSMSLRGPDGAKKCGVYVSLNFYPDKGGVAHVGSRTTCTVTKLKFGLSGNLCQVVRKGVKATSPVCVRIDRPGRLIQFDNVG